MSFILWRLCWFLTPLWLGTLIYKKTGYIFAMKASDKKPVKFYFQRERPVGFTKWGNSDRSI